MLEDTSKVCPLSALTVSSVPKATGEGDPQQTQQGTHDAETGVNETALRVSIP